MKHLPIILLSYYITRTNGGGGGGGRRGRREARRGQLPRFPVLRWRAILAPPGNRRDCSVHGNFQAGSGRRSPPMSREKRSALAGLWRYRAIRRTVPECAAKKHQISKQWWWRRGRVLLVRRRRGVPTPGWRSSSGRTCSRSSPACGAFPLLSGKPRRGRRLWRWSWNRSLRYSPNGFAGGFMILMRPPDSCDPRLRPLKIWFLLLFRRSSSRISSALIPRCE